MEVVSKWAAQPEEERSPSLPNALQSDLMLPAEKNLINQGNANKTTNKCMPVVSS